MIDLTTTTTGRGTSLFGRPTEGRWTFFGASSRRRRHYVSSKVMCWVALDRAIDLADFLGDGADVERWRKVRDEIRARVLDEA